MVKNKPVSVKTTILILRPEKTQSSLQGFSFFPRLVGRSDPWSKKW